MRRHTTLIVFAAFFVLACLTMLIPLSFARWAPPAVLNGAGLVVILEILVILLMSVLPVAWRWSTVGLLALTEPLSLMSGTFLLYYVLRGGVLLFRDYIGEPDLVLRVNTASHTDLAIALAYAIAGFCAFHIGYRFWNPPRRRTDYRPRPAWSSRKVNQAAVVGVCFASFSTLIAFLVSGGLGGVLSSFGRLREVTAGYGYALIGLGYWGVMFAFVLRDRLQRHKNILPALALLGMANLCDAFFGNRNGVLATWITGFMLYIYSLQGRKSLRTAVLLICVLTAGIGFALPMARARETAKSMADVLRMGREYWTNSGVKIALFGSDEFCALDAFDTIIAVPSQFPLRYGGTYVDSLLFVIPRSLWPDKPRSFSFAIGQYLFAAETDLPPGYIGELYINFHLAGVIGGMYLLGWLLRRAHQWTLSGDPIALTVYSVLIPYTIAFMGRSFIGGGTLTLIPLVLMLPVIYFLRRRPAGQPRPFTAPQYSLAPSPGYDGGL
jgi:hypothetical protein